ncbi:MAG: hypothetical protein HY719_11330, partial [Planctomycetes bacterium]|nr:hypothetical protein [Planctomycetota bacterium]
MRLARYSPALVAALFALGGAMLATARPAQAQTETQMGGTGTGGEASSSLKTITYQGRLTDTQGNALTGTYDFEFGAFTSESATTASWTESHAAVGVESGFYRVDLGSIAALPESMFAAADLYIEMKVKRSGDASFDTLTPRARLGWAPFAFSAAMLGGLPAAHYLDAGNLTGALADARLSANVARLDGANVFTGSVKFEGGAVVLGKGDVGATLALQADTGALSRPALQFNGAAGRWEISNDGAVFSALSGTTTGSTFSGSATDLTTGTLADARLSSSVTLQGNAFNGPNQLARLDASGALPAVSGANLTGLNYLPLAGGTLAGPVTFAGGQACAGSGAGLTNVDAATLGGNSAASFRDATTLNVGTIADARL